MHHSLRRNPLLYCLTLGALASIPQAMAEPRPAVVELFTSEGCSSCPPAEAYLAELARRDDVLALAFHVDYWDGLGWRDPFSLKAATQRQNQYAHMLRRSSVYTPQAIVDGQSDHVGSDRGAIGKSLAKARTGIPLTLSVKGAEVRIAIGAAPVTADCEVTLVGYLRQATSAIHSGENSGRTLKESNVVRSIETLGHWNGAAVTLAVPTTSMAPDVTDLAVVVQAKGPGAIVGVASFKLR